MHLKKKTYLFKVIYRYSYKIKIEKLLNLNYFTKF